MRKVGLTIICIILAKFICHAGLFYEIISYNCNGDGTYDVTFNISGADYDHPSPSIDNFTGYGIESFGYQIDTVCYDPSTITGLPCTTLFDPVCACNGVTYSNSCFASEAGYSNIISNGNCSGLEEVEFIIRNVPVGVGIQISIWANYFPDFQDFFETITLPIINECYMPGCTDPEAHNYNSNATDDDGSCLTCNDGLQNGDETGVDCGGINPNCPPCAAMDSIQPFVTTWVTNNPGISCDSCIRVPTNSSTIYNYEVDVDYVMGEPFVADFIGVTGDFEWNAGREDTVTIAIRGEFPRIYFNDFNTNNEDEDSDKLIDIVQWGDIEWQSMAGAFRGCINMDASAIDTADISRVTVLNYCFADCISFNGRINGWNVSNVTVMSNVFENASSFNRPLDNWDLTLTTAIFNMFSGASSFNQDLSSWDVSNIQNMSFLFRGASNFNQDLSSWNVSNVQNMTSMFNNATRFNSDISNWNVASVTDMWSMFSGASSFNQDLSTWNTSNVVNAGRMFQNAIAFNFGLPNWNLSSVLELNSVFDNSGLSCENYSATLVGWAANPNTPTNLEMQAQGMEYNEQGVEARNILIGKGWTISGDVPCMTSMPIGCGLTSEQLLCEQWLQNVLDFGYDFVGNCQTPNCTFNISVGQFLGEDVIVIREDCSIGLDFSSYWEIYDCTGNLLEECSLGLVGTCNDEAPVLDNTINLQVIFDCTIDQLPANCACINPQCEPIIQAVVGLNNDIILNVDSILINEDISCNYSFDSNNDVDQLVYNCDDLGSNFVTVYNFTDTNHSCTSTIEVINDGSCVTSSINCPMGVDSILCQQWLQARTSNLRCQLNPPIEESYYIVSTVPFQGSTHILLQTYGLFLSEVSETYTLFDCEGTAIDSCIIGFSPDANCDIIEDHPVIGPLLNDTTQIFNCRRDQFNCGLVFDTSTVIAVRVDSAQYVETFQDCIQFPSQTIFSTCDSVYILSYIPSLNIGGTYRINHQLYHNDTLFRSNIGDTLSSPMGFCRWQWTRWNPRSLPVGNYRHISFMQTFGQMDSLPVGIVEFSIESPHPDLEGLMALYDNTGGDNWIDNTGWNEGSRGESCDPCNYNGDEWIGIKCSGGRVTEINLTLQNLLGELPSEISLLDSLEVLALSRNQLSGEIPSSIVNLQNLSQLRLGANDYSGEIPNFIYQMDQLEWLWLYSNRFSGQISTDIMNLNRIESIGFFNNDLEGELPSELGLLPNLRHIDLSNNLFEGCFDSLLLPLCDLGYIGNTILEGFGGSSSFTSQYKFDNNVNLPFGGNFSMFCSGESQISAPCGSRLDNFINVDAGCACVPCDTLQVFDTLRICPGSLDFVVLDDLTPFDWQGNLVQLTLGANSITYEPFPGCTTEQRLFIMEDFGLCPCPDDEDFGIFTICPDSLTLLNLDNLDPNGDGVFGWQGTASLLFGVNTATVTVAPDCSYEQSITINPAPSNDCNSCPSTTDSLLCQQWLLDLYPNLDFCPDGTNYFEVLTLDVPDVGTLVLVHSVLTCPNPPLDASVYTLYTCEGTEIAQCIYTGLQANCNDPATHPEIGPVLQSATVIFDSRNDTLLCVESIFVVDQIITVEPDSAYLVEDAPICKLFSQGRTYTNCDSVYTYGVISNINEVRTLQLNARLWQDGQVYQSSQLSTFTSSIAGCQNVWWRQTDLPEGNYLAELYLLDINSLDTFEIGTTDFTVISELGNACDDFDNSTYQDTINASCVCEGIPCPGDEDFGTFSICRDSLTSFEGSVLAGDDPNGDGVTGWQGSSAFVFGLNTFTVMVNADCSYEQVLLLEELPLSECIMVVDTCMIELMNEELLVERGDTIQLDLLANDEYPEGVVSQIVDVSNGDPLEELTFEGGVFSCIVSELFFQPLIITYEVCDEDCLVCEEATLTLINTSLDDITPTNLFSPNGDGIDEVLRFSNEPEITDSELWIYNRWGDQIYHKENYTNDWDASGYPGGVYFYVLRVRGVEVKSSLTIIK